MSNLLTSGLAYNPYFYANSALMVLYNRLGMAFYVNRSLERDKASQKGDTIQVRRAQTFVAQSMPIATASFADVSPNYDNLVINQWMGQGFKLTDKEKSLTPAAFVQDHITPVAVSIANQIDQNLASLTLECPWEVAAQTSSPYYSDFANGRKQLFLDKAPVINPQDYAYMTDAVLQSHYESDPTFVQAYSDADQGELQRVGQLGVKFGFRIFPNQNTVTYTSGTGALTTPVVTASKGANTINITGTTGSGTLKRGTILQIAGDPQQYAVQADSAVAAGGTTATAIVPNLQQAAAGAAVTFLQTSRTSMGLMFHREAFALVMQPLEDAGPGVLSATVQDPITGLTLRSRIWGDGGLGATIWCLDALWGYKTLNGNLAVRISI